MTKIAFVITKTRINENNSLSTLRASNLRGADLDPWWVFWVKTGKFDP